VPEAFQGLLDVFGEVREPSCDLEFERADSVGSIESRRAWERFTWMNGIPSLGARGRDGHDLAAGLADGQNASAGAVNRGIRASGLGGEHGPGSAKLWVEEVRVPGRSQLARRLVRHFR